MQCTANDAMIDSGHAHKALDDCIVVWRITHIFAERVGISMEELLTRFSVELDLAPSTTQLTTLPQQQVIVATSAQVKNVP